MQYKIQYDNNGNPQEVIIEEDIFKGHEDENPRYVVRKYLENIVQNTDGAFATIMESGQKVYLGEDLPGEYSYSKSSKAYKGEKFKVKGQIAQGLHEAIEIATNRKWEKNTKNKHEIDAKYGWYKYETRLKVNNTPYSAVLLIRNDANGKKYLYDVLSVNKTGTTREASNLDGSAMNGNSSYTNNTTGAEESQEEIAYNDADVPNTPLADALGNIDINSIYKNGRNDAGDDFRNKVITPVSPSVNQGLTPPSSEGGSGQIELKGRSEFGSDEAYAHYLIDVGQKELAKVPKITRAFLEAIARRTGLKIVIGDTGAITGQKSAGGYSRSRDVLVLDYDTVQSPEKLARAVINHELVHATETSVFYKSLEKHAFEQMFGGDEKALNEAIKKKQERYARSGVKLDRDGAKAELVARYIGESVLTSEAAINRLVIEKPTLAMQIKNALVKTYGKAKTYFTDKEAYEARYVMSDLEKGIRLFEKALDTRRNFKDFAQRLSGNTGGDVQYAKKLGGYIPENSVTSEGVLDKYNIKNINNKYEVISKVAEELKKTYLSTETQSKPIVNIDTGMEIEIRKGGINETFGNDKYFGDLPIEDRLKKLSVMPYLANMIKYGEVRSPDRRNEYNPNSKVMYSYLKSQIEIDGKPYTVNMDIRKSPNGENRFYIHSLNIKEDVDQLGHNVNRSKDGQTSSYTNNTTERSESQGKFAYKDADVLNTPFADALGNIDINSIYKNGENDAGNDWQRAKPVNSQQDLKSNAEDDIIESKEFQDYAAELPMKKIKAKHFPSYKTSKSDSHEQATRWAHREDVATGGQRYLSHSGSWYLIEKFDSMSDKYQIVGKVNTNDFEKLINEVKKYDRFRKTQNVQRGSDEFTGFDTSGDRSAGGGRSVGINAVEYGGENERIQHLGTNETGGREVYGNTGRSDEYDSTNRADSVVNDFRFSTPVAETQQEFGEITTRRAYDYFKKNRNSYKKEIGRMFGVPGKDLSVLDADIDAYAKEYFENGAVSAETKNRLFENAWDNGIVVDDTNAQLGKEIRAQLKKQTLYIDPNSARDIPDFGKFRLSQMGNMTLSMQRGYSVDAMYQELSESYGNLFPADITASSDRLLKISEVMAGLTEERYSLDTLYGAEQKADYKQEFLKNTAGFEKVLGDVVRYEADKTSGNGNAEGKVNKDIVKEQKLIEQSIAKVTARSQGVSRLYERVYEDNVNVKVTDACFMKLSHKYKVERDELKNKILELNQQLAKISEVRDGKEHFLSCVRNFVEMNEVTPMILQELIEKIEVHAVEGTGLNRTQSVVIHYKFIGELDMPENFDKIKVNTRKGVEVEYLRTTKMA